MAIITLWEVFDLIVMTLFLGFIFSGMFRPFAKPEEEGYDPLEHFKKKQKTKFFTDEMKLAIIVTAPAIVLHEMGHKFVAMAYGVPAVFHAFYYSGFTLALGIIAIIMRLINFGFLFVVPGFVSICEGAASCPLTPMQSAIIAFAGPGVNLLLFLGSWIALKSGKVNRKYLPILQLTKQINMFLFFFNMIPIGPFDGATVFRGIFGSF